MPIVPRALPPASLLHLLRRLPLHRLVVVMARPMPRATDGGPVGYVVVVVGMPVSQSDQSNSSPSKGSDGGENSQLAEQREGAEGRGDADGGARPEGSLVAAVVCASSQSVSRQSSVVAGWMDIGRTQASKQSGQGGRRDVHGRGGRDEGERRKARKVPEWLVEKDRAKYRDTSSGRAACLRKTFCAVMSEPLPTPIATCPAASRPATLCRGGKKGWGRRDERVAGWPMCLASGTR